MNASLFSALAALALFGGVASPAAAQAPVATEPAIVRDARESAPIALLGVWRADIAASTYTGAPPADQFRTFQYTADGRVLVSFMTLQSDGRVSSGHWSVGLDGDPGLEYFSGNGMTPYAVIKFQQRDPVTFDLTNSHYGAVASTAVYRLSDEGRTLTIERTPGDGPATRIVYRRWAAR